MNNGLRKAIKFILAYGIAVALGVTTGWGITRIDLLLPLLCLLFYVLFDLADRRIISGDMEYTLAKCLALDGIKLKDIRPELKFALPLACIFSLSVVAGSHLDVWNDVIDPYRPVDLLLLILYTVLFTFLLIVFFRVSDRWNEDVYSGADTAVSKQGKDKNGSKDASVDMHKGSAKRVLIGAGILILCYLPYYLTLFPGNLGKDTFESVDMVLGNIPWTNHHPIFFTILIDIVFTLTGWMGSYTASLATLSFLHMIAVALTLSYIADHISRLGSNGRMWSRIALVFFALHPFFPMYSIYMTKDVLFSCALALLVLKLHDLYMAYSDDDTDVTLARSGSKQITGLWVISLLVMLLRNNGLMIIAVLALILLICWICRSSSRKNTGVSQADKSTGFADLKPVFTLAISVMLFLIFRTVSYSVLDIAPESFAESASVPLQQVGYVIRSHTDAEMAEGLTKEQDEILKKIMPYEKVREVYDLGYTDAYKFDEAFDDEYFNEHKADFMKIWSRLLPGHFIEYVNAYLAQTAGYWNYGQTNTVATQGVWEDNSIGVVRTDLIEEMTGVSLYGIIEKLMLGMRKAPLLCILSSMAMQFYAVLLAMIMLWRRIVRHGQEDNRKGQIGSVVVTFAPLLLLWISIMIATPAFCLFRYMFAFFILWPFTLYMMIYSKGKI